MTQFVIMSCRNDFEIEIEQATNTLTFPINFILVILMTYCCFYTY